MSPLATAGEQLFQGRYLTLATWLVAKRHGHSGDKSMLVKKILSRAYAEVERYRSDGCYFALIMKHICKLCKKNNAENKHEQATSVLKLLIDEGRGLENSMKILGFDREVLALKLRKELLRFRARKNY